jgi:hypothetical protein
MGVEITFEFLSKKREKKFSRFFMCDELYGKFRQMTYEYTENVV